MTYVTAANYQIKIFKYLLYIVTISLLVFLLQFIWYRRKMLILSRKIPGPPAIPFVASICLLRKSIKETVRNIILNLNTFPGLMKLWIGTKLYIFILKAEYIETILHNPNVIEKDETYNFVTEFTGQGLLTLPAKLWKVHRKMIAPSFNQRMLDSFVKVFAEKSEIFVDHLKKVVGQQDIDLYLLSTRCTLDMICESALGVNMNIQSSNNTMGPLLDKAFKIIFKRVASIWHRIGIFWNLCRMKKDYAICTKIFNDIIQKIVDKQVMENNERIKNQPPPLTAQDDEATLKRKSILDFMLNNTSYSQDEMISEVKIFIIAGTETTAATLCFVFTMLGMYPDIQEKVYEEIINTLGPDRAVEASDISQLKYTDRVIKETMRLFPVVTFFARKLTGPIDLEDGITLPEDSKLVFPIFMIHRSPRYWKCPLKFDPDRFLPEEVAKRNNLGFFPFSLGPRNCIGHRYAMMNMKTVLATTIRKFRVFTKYESVESIDLKVHTFLRMTKGPKIRFELR